MMSSLTTGPYNTDNMPDQCRSQNSTGCFQNLLENKENITAQSLSLDTVTTLLTTAINASEKILESSSSVSPTELASYGNRVLKISEKLISTLVKPTDTSDNVSFTLATVEGQIFMVGPNVALDKIPRLDTTSSSVDIDLIGIANNNIEGFAAVAFMSFHTMENLLKPDFFNTSNDVVKTMMSTVISVTLPRTTNTKLTKPVNFTLKHIRDSAPSGSLSCVYWNISEWIVDGCSVLETNSNYTVCSCVHLSTFALMQTSPRPSESDPRLDLLTLVCVTVGLVFLSSALLTFALCRWTRIGDWIVGHSGCVRLVPGGYVRELSGNSTGRASEDSAVDPTTSKVSQEKQNNVTLNLERVNQNIYSNA
ncbi:adhesion G protein-coupled receptor E3-like [Pimephales promelas]|uniref:adhesion G protein-coupled receptor E3-like n=1 Tax=Pimephales promelas TaxID=90988 RepID=UPI001955AF01|nr:adhesion G protein-coupled receptor E3-like [Pimephales promelas]